MKNKLTENTILDGIQEGKTIAMNCYTLTDKFVKNLEIVLRSILNHYDKIELLPAIFGTTQELVNWTCISNMRYIYYQQNNLDLNDEEVFKENESRFLNSINKINSANYRDYLKSNDMYVHMVFEHQTTGLNVKVYNVSENTLDQEKYLRTYLKQAMHYSNVLDYFKDHLEDPQGKNMGLAFSIIILKESGLRPDLMRISKSGKGCYSRIEIPFVNEYESIRDKILKDEMIVPFARKSLVPPEFQAELENRIKTIAIDSYDFLQN
ncbi:MAG: hypothetical protein IPL26_09915 [Leptospiraceae bacterium]|nr:hypothetical protein [Leptospiraceae bacterium]